MSEALVKKEFDALGSVRAANDPAGTLEDYRQMQARIDKVMPDAIMTIRGKPFRKKAYWRAIARGFNLTLTCVKDERQEHQGDWGYIATYRATAPNGCFADGDGACFASEKQAAVQRTVHNVRGHAHTRAMNRAVSNLVGFGEVSAEEAVVEADDPRPTQEEAAQDIGPNWPEDEPAEPGSNDGPVVPQVITDKQRKRLFAIAKEGSVPETIIKAIIAKRGYESTSEIQRIDYDSVVQEIQEWKR